MLKEYAVQPELLSNWPVCRDLSEKFGYSRGRVIARYPKRWERLVLDSLHDCMPMEKKKIVERLTILKNSALYPRHHEWDPAKLWLNNAMAEHDKRPFCAIISQDNPKAFAAVISRADLDELEEPRWQIERQRRIQRTATEMAACAEPLLRNARVILFVDPHFIPDVLRFKRPLQAFLQIVAHRPAGIPTERIEIHTGHKSVEPKERFYELRSIIPRGREIRLVRWDQSYLHDRFILTNACGLECSAGLDENSRTYAHVTLLEPGLYSATWEDYQRDSSRIPCIEDDLIIEGTAG
jgi:hypothetical protein